MKLRSFSLGCCLVFSFGALNACGESSSSASGTDMKGAESASGDTDDSQSGENPTDGDDSSSDDTKGSSTTDDDDSEGKSENADDVGSPNPEEPTDESPVGDPDPVVDDEDPVATLPPADSGDGGAEPSVDAGGAEDGGDPKPGPELEPEDNCTDMCPVPRICQPCGDGCAQPYVPCAEGGGCGEVQWLCDEADPAVDPVKPGPKPVDGECPASCPVPALCKLCDDGNCASASITCNDDGSCGAIDWVCSDASTNPGPKLECRSAADCPQILAVCKECPDGGFACPSVECVDNACVTVNSECTADYDPCAGKANGDNCTLCAPNDGDCLETDEIKTCQDGRCSSAVISAQ